MKIRILVINGPNMNLLGLREPEIYGKRDYAALVEYIREAAEREGMETDFFQSNHEGAIVDRIQEAYGVYDGLILNPAAYTHTSIAIPDALRAVSIPTVEVHLSDISAREDFRKISYTSPACEKTIAGLGFEGYVQALLFLRERLAGMEKGERTI